MRHDAGPMASFSRRNDEPTRRAPNATSRPVAEGEREYGRIVTLKESFGFIPVSYTHLTLPTKA